MTTKELIKRLGGFKDSKTNEFLNEIIGKLEELEELKRVVKVYQKYNKTD